MTRILHLVMSLFFTLSPVWAHEGHHGAPGSVAAPHGGKMKMTNTLNLELVSSKDGVRLYAFDKEMKTVTPGDLRIEATVKYPRNPKAEPVAFVAENEYFKAVVDTKGLHRYTLEVRVTHDDKSEKASFNVEPK